MDTTTSPSLPKPRLLQDLWSELSTVALFLSEITWAAVIFCTLFNLPLDYLQIGSWFALLGFITYFGARIIAHFTVKRWAMPVFSAVWLLISLMFFLKFVIYAGSPLNLWHMILDPFVNLSKQPVLQCSSGRCFSLCAPAAWIHPGRLQRQCLAGGALLPARYADLPLLWVYHHLGALWLNLSAFLLYLLFAFTAMTTSRLASLTDQLNYRLPVFTKSWFGWIFALTLALILVGSRIGWLMGVACWSLPMCCCGSSMASA